MGGRAKPTGTELRVAFWNAWLLAPRLWPGGPKVPGGERFFAPDVQGRAPLVGEALRGRFDVVALGEVFEPSERAGVSHGWPEAALIPGPGRSGIRPTTSGLATLADEDRVRVPFVARHGYRAGGDVRDSDTFATKGALLTTLLVGDDVPPVDLVSTHLFAGGDLFPVPGANDQARHHRARMGQVDELLRFVEHQHDPDHVLLVVGDFNVAEHDPDPALDDPTERYCDLADRMTSTGLEDLWRAHGIGPGHTCSFKVPADVPADPDEPDAVADDPKADPLTSPGERIDYLWLSAPDGVRVDVARPRRWAFPGRGRRGGRAGSLSDHLAVSTTLMIHPSG